MIDMTQEPVKKVKRKKIAVAPVQSKAKIPRLESHQVEGSEVPLIQGPASPSQLLAAQHGMYTLTMAARLVGRSPVTVRRWLRFEECPKPSHSIPYNAYEMQLFDDNDIALLKEWADAMRPGPKNNRATRTKRRRPNEPFFRETEHKTRFYGTTKTLMPRRETPIEFWAKRKGMGVVEYKHDTGKNIVTLQRMVPLDEVVSRRAVKPNIPKKLKKRERRITTGDSDGAMMESHDD